MESLTNKTIFISPLDWGFGHSTRCVPIIHQLKKNNRIIIGVTAVNKRFFELHFPNLKKVSLPSYQINYSKSLPVWLKILSQFPKIKSIIKKEHLLLEKIVAENDIDVVISDNRFGLYNKLTENIFITHQLKIVAPFFSALASKINLNYIHKFNKVWVPDYENEANRLSGKLSNSEGLKIPVEYINPQSAMMCANLNTEQIKKCDVLLLLSGVEPQRSILEHYLLKKFQFSDKKIILVRGSDCKIKVENKNITVIDFAFGLELKALIVNAESVICRSGYSTLMDMYLLKKEKLILIPTPGQPEQEYLAQYWKEKFNAKVCVQKNISFFSFDKSNF